MAAAMWKYNLNEGIYAVREYELPLIMGLASLAVAATGGGPFTLDRLIFLGRVKVEITQSAQLAGRHSSRPTSASQTGHHTGYSDRFSTTHARPVFLRYRRRVSG